MSELNEPQRQAVLHRQGPLLVFAGAGSGKTRVITYRIARLLAEDNVPPYRILAVTFTNKAAGEMRARLEALTGPDFTRDLWIGTFHSVCARLLRRYHADVGLEPRFVIYDDGDQKAVVNRILRDRNLSDRAYPPKVVLSRINRLKREGIRPSEVEESPSFDEEIIEVYRRYEQALATANAVDFDDLILKVMRLAEDPSSSAGADLRSRYFHVLVDEFQDTNLIQYRLVRALSSGTRNLCVVGDDDQSIYSWRGADVRNILDFRRDFPDATVVKLEQNYRSTQNIVAAALGIIQHAEYREPKALFSTGPKGDRVRVRTLRDEREEAMEVLRIIRREIDRGVKAREIAVFYRIHAQSRVLEEALRSAGMPYQIVGGMKFFERAEVKDLLAYLRLVDNPRSDADLLRIVNVPARGIGAKTLDRLLAVAVARDTSIYDAILPFLADADVNAGAKKKLEAFRDLIEGFRGEGTRMSPHELAKHILEETGYEKALRDEDTAEADARVENLEELVGSLLEYEREAEVRGESPTLSGYLERVSLIADVDAMKTDDMVTLMTVHGAKGLEFTTVVLTGMEEETFPYRGIEGDAPEELDEERRLAYVAVTRARERLFITHAQSRMLFGQTKYKARSRFLFDLPKEAVEMDPVPARPWEHGGGGGWNRYANAPSSPPPRPRLAPGERVVEYDADVPASDDEYSVNLRPGQHVVHKRFGRGVVQRVEAGVEPTVVVTFPGFGQKKLRAEFLSFE